MTKRLVYLDNAATTPVRPEVLEAMLPYLGKDAFGNPSSAHRFGRAARAGVEEAKRTIAAQCSEAGVSFHSYAVQALGKVHLSLREVGCTLLTISGHKIGAPKGIGALIVRDRHAVEAIIHGGGQQFGIRPGTENVPGIIALGKAVQLAMAEQAELARRLRALRDDLERRLVEVVPDAVIHGGRAERAPHVTNVSFPGTDSEALLMPLDLAGIACFSGSALLTGD